MKEISPGRIMYKDITVDVKIQLKNKYTDKYGRNFFEESRFCTKLVGNKDQETSY